MAECSIMIHADILSILTSKILALNYGSVWKTWMCLSKQHYTATLAYPNAKIQLANRRATLESLCGYQWYFCIGALPAHMCTIGGNIKKEYITIHTNIKNYRFGKFEDITFRDVINNPKLKFAYHLLPKNKNFSAKDVDKLYELRLIRSVNRVSYHGISLAYLTKRNLIKHVGAILNNPNVTAEIVRGLPVRPIHWNYLPIHIALELGIPVNTSRPDYFKYVDLSATRVCVQSIKDYRCLFRLAENKTLTLEMALELIEGETCVTLITNPNIIISLYERNIITFAELAASACIPWTYVYEQYLLQYNARTYLRN